MKNFKSLWRRFSLLLTFFLLSLYQLNDVSAQPARRTIIGPFDPFGQFLAKHTIDPQLHPENWNAVQWINYLRNTANPALRAAGKSKEDLTQKYINTIIVATPATILENFVDNQRIRVPDYDLRWSENPLDTYVIKWNPRYNTHEVYHCGQLYTRVGYLRYRPKSLRAYYPEPVEGRNTNYPIRNCNLVP